MYFGQASFLLFKPLFVADEKIADTVLSFALHVHCMSLGFVESHLWVNLQMAYLKILK